MAALHIVLDARLPGLGSAALFPQHVKQVLSLHHTRALVVEARLVEVEAAVGPFAARPHWGELVRAQAAAIAPLYERLPDLVRLVERLDPRGALRKV